MGFKSFLRFFTMGFPMSDGKGAGTCCVMERIIELGMNTTIA